MSEIRSDRSSHWILLRGLAREARHWEQFPLRLEAALNSGSVKGSRVDAIDLPGAGRYSEMKSPFSIKETAEFVRGKFLEVRARLRESGEEPPSQVCLVAISLGGMIACEWITEWPDDVNACAMISTSFKGYSPAHRRLTPLSLLHFKRIFKARDSYEREKEVLRLISNRPELRAKVAKEWSQLALSRPFSRENFFRQLFAASRFTPRIDESPVPVLLLTSRGDRMVHPSCSEEIAKRWQADIRFHPDAGHDLPLDEPEWVIEQLVGWWQNIGERSEAAC